MDTSRMDTLLGRWGGIPDAIAWRKQQMGYWRKSIQDEHSPASKQADPGMPKSRATSDSTAHTALSSIDHIQQAKDSIAALDAANLEDEKLKAILDLAVSELPIDEMNVIRLRYKERADWDKIAETMHVCGRTARRYKQKALERLSVCIF